MVGRRPRYYPQKQDNSHGTRGFTLGAIVASVSLLALVVLLGTVARIDLLVLAWLFAAVPMLARGRLRAGVSVDDHGVTEWFPLGIRRRTPWGEIVRIDDGPNRARLRTFRHDVELGPSLCDWRHLVDHCLHAKGQGEPGEPQLDGPHLPPETVAGWLGIDPDDTLVLRSRGRFGELAWQIGVFTFAALLLMQRRDGSAHLYALWPAALITAITWWRPGAAAREVREVRASAGELRLRTGAGWRRVAWGDVLSAGRDAGKSLVLQTVDGEYWLPDDLHDRHRLYHALTEAAAARALGQTLPRLGADVSGAAISLVRPDEVAVERGISAAESGL